MQGIETILPDWPRALGEPACHGRLRVQPEDFQVEELPRIEPAGEGSHLWLEICKTDANTDWVEINDFDKDYLSTKYNPENDYKTVKSKTKWSLSPRLGISHPITENSKLFFNYGHFKQLPTYEELLRISRTVTGSMQNYG